MDILTGNLNNFEGPITETTRRVYELKYLQMIGEVDSSGKRTLSQSLKASQIIDFSLLQNLL